MFQLACGSVLCQLYQPLPLRYLYLFFLLIACSSRSVPSLSRPFACSVRPIVCFVSSLVPLLFPLSSSSSFPGTLSTPYPAKMAAEQEGDALAWDRSDELWDEAVKQIRLSSVCRKIAAFAEKTLAKPATFVSPLVMGGFNVLYPIRTEGHSDDMNVLVRLPCPSQVVFPEEKTLAEAATVAYVSQHTRLPIPKLFNYGVDPDIGPFMIIQDLGSRRNLMTVLEADISELRLKCLYGKVARLVLQLAQPTFSRIGALVETSPGSGSFHVMARPLTHNMSIMVLQSNIPKSIFPPQGTTYQTADEWYAVLAEMQIATLIFQHNDMVSSDDDCKTKYVARQLFRRLARQGRLSTFGFAQDNWSAQCNDARKTKEARGTLPAPGGSGSFRLWSDDFRPANIVVDDSEEANILGVIDWEFAYVGPTHFPLDPPWWLLNDRPETWVEGLDDWVSVYERRLQTWLLAMEEAEKLEDLPPNALLLSAYMRESWATGRFWLNYIARKSWAFDTLYWRYLDERFFGDREEDIPTEELWKTRVHLLTQDERDAMEPLVQTKMEESKERVLVEWGAVEARERLSSFLFD